MADTAPLRQIQSGAPIFFVADLTKSADYYVRVLGFNVPMLWGEPPGFCIASRDGVSVMLDQIADPGQIRPNGNFDNRWDAYFWVRDADALHAEFAAKGAHIVYPPTDKTHYEMREFAVRDPDGYVLAFAHDISGTE
jgi:catechol 2,3-dioxygenase-like lactoylglutathione lyase family enzyme